MKTTNKLISGLFLILAAISCNPASVNRPDASQLMQADRDFSLLSVKSGMKKAFIEYADTSVVMLRNYNYPIEGKQSMKEALKNIPDSLFTLKWEPLKAAIANSGELGYTYGLYERIPVDTLNGKKISRGSYVTVWKKQFDGSWKFTFDAGNEGLGK